MRSFRLHPELIVKTKKTIFHQALDFLFAILLSFTGIAVVTLIGPPISTTPLLIYIPLIMLSASNGGLAAGIITSIVFAVIINFIPLQPVNYNKLIDFVHVFQLILFAAEGSFISFIINMLMHRESIGEYKKRERTLNKKILELEELNLKFEKEIRSRDEFLSIASHELKTPLTSMLLQTQTALHNIRNVSVAEFSFEKLLKMLESVENQTKRLSKMINDLLAVSIITVGNLNLEYEEIDLGNLTKGVLTDFEAKIEKGKYVIHFNAEEKIVGSWDKIRIEQAISNFISNAIKYGDNKPIEIAVKKNNRFAEFIIKDSGIGISKQKQKRIFELFQRAVSAEQYKGLGVGLYITQKIVSAHGGTVDVSSDAGSGAKFVMKLPLKRPASVQS